MNELIWLRNQLRLSREQMAEQKELSARGLSTLQAECERLEGRIQELEGRAWELEQWKFQAGISVNGVALSVPKQSTRKKPIDRG